MTSEGFQAIEETDRYILPLGNRKVSRIYIDFALGLFFWEAHPKLEIRIEGKIRIMRNSMPEVIVDPSKPESLGPALFLFNRTVRWAHAFKDGTLKIQFTDNNALQVDPGIKYEPWEVASEGGLKGMKLVSLPGGSIAFWQGEQP